VIALPITVRDMVWWDGQQHPFPSAAFRAASLPVCGVIKLTGRTAEGHPVLVSAKAGRNTGHHYHLDIGHFVVHVDGESLLCDPGSGLYTRAYFGNRRFENIFCNSFGHSLPRIGGRQQMPGPKFGGGLLAEGKIVDYRLDSREPYAVIDFAALYGLPELSLARRKLHLVADTGEIWLEDTFAFAGEALDIEEAFVTWNHVTVEAKGSTARIAGQQHELLLAIQEPAEGAFTAARLTEACRANGHQDTLTRLTVHLPPGTPRFAVKMLPVTRPGAESS
jgi:hypothetical protein